MIIEIDVFEKREILLTVKKLMQSAFSKYTVFLKITKV